MNSIAIPVGIDVSKDTLAVYIERKRGKKRLTVSNDAKGIEKIIKELGQGQYLISLEATGRFESLAYRMLEEYGYWVKVQNPRLAKKLAEGLGIEAKSDGIDAETLSVTGQFCRETHPRSKLREELGDMSRGIEALIKERSGFKKRLGTRGLNPIVVQSYLEMIKSFTQQIESLKKQFKARVKETELLERYKLLLSVYGFGEETARILTCELDENLDQWTNKQIASYGGVVPKDHSSGKSKKPAKLTLFGNKRVKAALYFPAMTLIRRDPKARAKYLKFIEQGRNHQQAILPIMHMQLRRAIAVLKRGSAFMADPPQRH